MKPQKTKDVMKFLRGLGWVYLRNGKGSHEIWGLPDGSQRASIPAGHKEVTPGVLNQIEDAGVKLPREWR